MSGLTVKYFMWSYQPHFQSSAERSARELFNHLLPELDTSLFLVGIKVCENEKRLPLCVEPDHCTVQPSAFETIEREFQKTLENDDRSKMIYSNPTAEKRVHERIRTQSMARAIEKCCAAARATESHIHCLGFRPGWSITWYPAYSALTELRASHRWYSPMT